MPEKVERNSKEVQLVDRKGGYKKVINYDEGERSEVCAYVCVRERKREGRETERERERERERRRRRERNKKRRGEVRETIR